MVSSLELALLSGEHTHIDRFAASARGIQVEFWRDSGPYGAVLLLAARGWGAEKSV
jgi:hypothetical protein